MERRPRRLDAIEMLNEAKRKHLRGVSQNRFDNLVYTDLIKRNKEANKQNKTQVNDKQSINKAYGLDLVQPTT